MVDDGEIVATLLASLLNSYSGLVTALEGRDEAALTVEYVTGKMHDEYLRRVEGGMKDKSDLALKSVQMEATKASTSTQSKTAKAKSSKGKKIYECYHCGKPDYIRKDCSAWKKLKQQANESGKASKDSAKIAGREQETLDDDNDGGQKFEYVSLKVTTKDVQGWLVDSGTTSHISPDRSVFHNLKKTIVDIRLARKTSLQTEGVGTITLHCKMLDSSVQKSQFRDALYVPDLDGGLLSISRLRKTGHTLDIDGICRVKREGKILAVATKQKGLYMLDIAQTVERVNKVDAQSLSM